MFRLIGPQPQIPKHKRRARLAEQNPSSLDQKKRRPIVQQSYVSFTDDLDPKISFQSFEG